MNSEKDVSLKSEVESKEQNKKDEAKKDKINLKNENSVTKSEDAMKDDSDKSSLGEEDDQLDFLFNEDEELDYEYDTVNGPENEEFNENNKKLSEINEEKTEDITSLDNDPVNLHEDYQRESENCSNNDDKREEETDFDEFDFDNFVVVDAEGDSDEHKSDARTDDDEDDDDEENSRDWRYKGKHSSNKDKPKSSAKDNVSKSTSKYKDREVFKSEKEKLPDRFEKIVVITDKLYKDFVAPLNSKMNKVEIIADDELTITSLPKILEGNKHKGEENALWVIVTGMYNLIKVKDMDKLKKMYIPHVDNTEVKKYSVSALIKEGKEMRRIIKSSLGASCAVVSCPPIPAALLVNQKDPMKELSYDLGRFTKEWTRMAREFFEQQRLAYNHKQFDSLSMYNVAGIHQIRFSRDDKLDLRNPSWKMLLSWYEIIESIIRFNVLNVTNKAESSQSKSPRKRRSRSSSRKRDDKSTNRPESARREKLDLKTTPKVQTNSEKETNEEVKEDKGDKDSNLSAIDNLILREAIEPSNDLLVVVIGEENAARNFCKMKIPNVRFKIVIMKRFSYRDMKILLPENILKSENILWVLLCDLSRSFTSNKSFCSRLFSKQRCKDQIFYASQLTPVGVSKKCTRIFDIVDDIFKIVGKNSYVILSPVIPQSILQCPLHMAKISKFHEYVHQIKDLKYFPIFQADDRDVISNYKLFEREWLKFIENMMKKQNLNFEFFKDYEKKKGKVVDVLSDPRKYRYRTESYKEWEGFMEALLITFSTSLSNDDKLSNKNETVKSETAEGDQVIKDKKKVDPETQIDNASSDLKQVIIDRISDNLRNEDFEKVLNVCGKIVDITYYKKKGSLFLFRKALVTFMNADSVYHASRLLHDRSTLSCKLSVEPINKSSLEVNSEVRETYEKEFHHKIKAIEIIDREFKERLENKQKDYKQERQLKNSEENGNDKENKNSRSSSGSGNLKRKSEEVIESKDGVSLKSVKHLKNSHSSESKKRNSKSPDSKTRSKVPEIMKRSRSIENIKSKSHSPDRKRTRPDDKLKDNEIQLTSINCNDREIVRVMTLFLGPLGGSKVRLGKSDERIIFRFANKNVANILCKLIGDFRFPDKHIKVATGSDTSSEVDNADMQFTAMHLDLVLKRIPHFAIYLNEAHSLWPGAYDLFKFKTKKCYKTHPVVLQRKLCVNCHGFTDSRRDPREHDYEAECCPEAWKSKKAKKLVCADGNKCKFSHTTMERVFHMSTLQKSVCMEWYPTQSCNANRLCADAHPETPEVLFRDVWRDVYLSGLEKTYQYLVGATQNLRHVLLTSQYGTGMQVLVVSPFFYVVKWLSDAILTLAQDHKLKVATATDQEWKTEKSDIVIATPGGALKLLSSRCDVSKSLKGLIIDDIGVMLRLHKHSLASIAQTLCSQRGSQDNQLNRVMVSETIYQNEVDSMAAILETEFTVLGATANGSPPQIPVDNLADLNEMISSGTTLCADERDVKGKMSKLGFEIPEGPEMKRTVADPRSDVRTDDGSGHKRQQHRESPSKSRQRVRSPSDRRQQDTPGHRRGARSPGARRRNRSPMEGRPREEASGKKLTRSISPRNTRELREESERSIRNREVRKSPKRGRLQQDSRSRSKPRESPRSRSRKRSFSPRSSTKRSPDNKKLQSGTSIYENLPRGGPPDYSKKSRNGGDEFVLDASVGGGGGPRLPAVRDASIKGPEIASSPWISGMEPSHLPTSDWRGAATGGVATPERSTTGYQDQNVGVQDFTNRMKNQTNRDFSIYDTCAMLTTICEPLGILGISFKATLQRAMEFKSNSQRMLETFGEPEVMALMEVVLKKIKELEAKSSGIERERSKTYLRQLTFLIEQAKALSQPPEASTKKILYGLDIENIAKVTLGKDNPYVISDIKNRLLDAHGRVDSDQFSEIFKAVSMLQFDLMINNSSPEKADISGRGLPDRSPEVFNQEAERFDPQVERDVKRGMGILGSWEKPKDGFPHISPVNDSWEQNRQVHLERNNVSGNEWEGKGMENVERNRNNWENVQQQTAMPSDAGRMDKYDPMEAVVEDEHDYIRDKDSSWDVNRKESHNFGINRNTRDGWESQFSKQETNSTSSDVWRQGTIKGMEQILGSSLNKGGSWQNQTEEQQSSEKYSVGNMQNRIDFQGLGSELQGNGDQVSGSGLNRWEYGHGSGAASSNPEGKLNNSREAQSGFTTGLDNWDHKQELGRGSAGNWMQPPTQHGSSMVDRRQSADFNEQQGLQRFTRSDTWNNPVEKDVMGRKVVDYGHQGSALSDRKVVDYGHQKGQASVSSTFRNDDPENMMDLRYRTDTGPQQPFSSTESNHPVSGSTNFMITSSATHGSQYGTQYTSEVQSPRMPHIGQRYGELPSSRFSDQPEPRLNEQLQSGSRFNNLPDTRFGNQIGSRFNEQPQPDARFGPIQGPPRTRDFSDNWF